jgi:acyl carrier protein
MNEQDLKETILESLRAIAPDAPVDDLGMNENIRSALDIDSFDHLNLLIALNTKLGVNIPEKDYGKLNTLADIINYISVRV